MTAAQCSAVAAMGSAASQSSSAFDASGSASSAQAFAIQRANHTGTQVASTISDFSTAAVAAVTWSTLTGKPTFSTVATTGAYSDLSGKPTLGTASAQNTTFFDAAGAAAAAQSASQPASAELTAIASLSSTGLAKRTGVGTWSIDASTYLTANQTVTLSGDVSGSGATAITATLAAVGTAGTYSGVTTDTKGRVTAGTSRSTSSTSRAISTTNNSANGYQASSSRDSWVLGNVSISNTSTISGPSSGTILLERCATNSTTGASWATVDTFTCTQAVTLAVALQLTNTQTYTLRGYIPAGWFYRYRSLTATGTVTYSASVNSEEVLL